MEFAYFVFGAALAIFPYVRLQSGTPAGHEKEVAVRPQK